MNKEHQLPPNYKQLSREELAASMRWNARRVQIENSDRALAIINGTELEELLGTLLLKFMTNDPRSVKMVSDNLGNFNARIRNAYCLGLISRDEHFDLDIVRQIRNYFAHNSRGSTFEDSKVLKWCRQLRIPQQRPDLFDSLSSSSQRFDATAFILKNNLFTRQCKAKNHKCIIPDEIDSKDWEQYF